MEKRAGRMLVCTLCAACLLLGAACRTETPPAEPRLSPVPTLADEARAVSDLTLCAPSDKADGLCGYGMQAVLDAPETAAVALFCSASELDAVRTSLTAALDADPAALETLDRERRARVLSGGQLAWLDGDVSQPVALYPDGVDLVSGEAVRVEECRFYLAAFSEDRVLWVGEATKKDAPHPTQPPDGAPHADEELYGVRLVRCDVSGAYDRMKGFQLAFFASPALVTADNTAGYLLFFTAAPQAEVERLLSETRADGWEALDTEGRVKIVRDLSYADGGANTFYASAVDLITGKTPLDTPGTYRFFAATLDRAGAVRFLAEADRTFLRE